MKSNKEENYWQGKINFENQKAIIPFELQSVSSRKADVYDFDISKAQSELLKKFTDGNELKVQIVFLAAMGLLLTKYNGEELIRFGTPADRHKDDIHPDVIIPLELEIKQGTSFRELLNETKNALVDGVFHQNFDFHLLWKEFESHDENPLYDIVCTYTNLQDSVLTNKVDSNLVFEFSLDEGQFSGRILFNENKYGKEFINCIAKNFMEYMNKGLLNLDEPLEHISLASQADETEFAVKNVVQTNESIVQKFQQVVHNNSNSIAIECGASNIDYNELNKKSNKLAHYLLENADREKSSCIGIYLENSTEVIIAMMGVLKAGFYFLPIDKTLPPQRILQILDDSKAEVLIVEGEITANLVPDDVQTLDIQDVSKFETMESTDLTISIAMDSIAYVIYTSGTSGTPKGVAISHQAFANYITWAAKFYTQNGKRSAVFPLFSSISFDLTITSIFVPLVATGRVLVHPTEPLDEVFNTILTNNKSSIIKLTPSHLELLSELLKSNPALCKSSYKLHTFIVGGEAFTNKLAAEILAWFPNVTIYNEYGPTEATVGCMIHKYVLNERQTITVPIGIPIDNAKILLRNRGNSKVPEGAIGEIFIGGMCLANGYLNNAELTNAKFVSISNDSEEKFYKSGDLAKKLTDGNYLYLGRKDSQVKINGYRIELKEIENYATRYPAINECVVQCNKISNITSKIVLYVTAEKEIIESDIMSFMAQFLPAYMVPQQLVQLENIPLTSNGKVDAKELTLFASKKPKELELPITENEKKLHAIWVKHLNTKEIGINDNFYTTGGDSIKSLGLMNEINKSFGLQMKVKDLYLLKSIKNLAAHITSLESEDIENDNSQQEDRVSVNNEMDKLKSEILNQL
jgi:iturin family lipopeptide synthetase C